MKTIDYVGTELEIFKNATLWKAYWSEQLSAFARGRCCEVGAGLGTNLNHLTNPRVIDWTLIEPDPTLFKELTLVQSVSSISIAVVQGDIQTVPMESKFDSIFYIDVLEHIHNHVQQLILANQRLAPAGKICIVVPAHEWLRSKFDDAVGHVRRYDREQIHDLATAAGLEILLLRELDSVGLFASLANRLLLRTGTPAQSQILFWDRFLVPISKIVDPMLGYRFGKSIVAVFQQPDLPTSLKQMENRRPITSSPKITL